VIKNAKSMTINMETKTYLKTMKMIRVTKIMMIDKEAIKMIDKTINLINKKVIRKKVKHMTKMIRVMTNTALRKLHANTLPG
jgi:hypothetical protein